MYDYVVIGAGSTGSVIDVHGMKHGLNAAPHSADLCCALDVLGSRRPGPTATR